MSKFIMIALKSLMEEEHVEEYDQGKDLLLEEMPPHGKNKIRYCVVKGGLLILRALHQLTSLNNKLLLFSPTHEKPDEILVLLRKLKAAFKKQASATDLFPAFYAISEYDAKQYKTISPDEMELIPWHHAQLNNPHLHDSKLPNSDAVGESEKPLIEYRVCYGKDKQTLSSDRKALLSALRLGDKKIEPKHGMVLGKPEEIKFEQVEEEGYQAGRINSNYELTLPLLKRSLIQSEKVVTDSKVSIASGTALSVSSPQLTATNVNDVPVSESIALPTTTMPANRSPALEADSKKEKLTESISPTASTSSATDLKASDRGTLERRASARSIIVSRHRRATSKNASGSMDKLPKVVDPIEGKIKEQRDQLEKESQGCFAFFHRTRRTVKYNFLNDLLSSVANQSQRDWNEIISSHADIKNPEKYKIITAGISFFCLGGSRVKKLLFEIAPMHKSAEDELPLLNSSVEKVKKRQV